jgi:hypothetical protein
MSELEDAMERIAELEAQNSKLLAERARLCTERNWECNEKLAAQEEVRQLREAAQLVVDKALTHSYLEGPVEQAIDALQAALLKEGGDDYC